MAFAIRNLSVLAYANGFTLWHYADMLAEGDMMIVSASDGGRIVTIASGTAGEITTAPLV